MMVGLLVLLQVATLSAQNPADTVYDRVILGGHVMDPASRLDAVRNIGLTSGRIAVITTHAILGRDTIDARGLVVAPGFIDLHAHGQTTEIAQRIEIGLREGAVDIGAGFPYTPAATREELLAVFRVAAKTKTPIHVHIRPGVAGLKEALALADETHAPLHVVHINSAGLAETPAMLEMISDARAHGRDVTTEAYPYDAGMTEIQSAPYRTSTRRLPTNAWPSWSGRLRASG